MSTKTKTPKTATKADAAKRTKAVAAAQAKDAAANAKAVKPAGKRTKTTTIDAGGGILVDVVETTTPTATPAPKSKKEPKAKKVSGLALVAQVLKDKGEPMAAKAIADAVIAAGWQTKGKTPAATLYSAMLREIDGKPGDSRFIKTGRGLFTLTNAKA